jgi:hypothetical protein
VQLSDAQAQVDHGLLAGLALGLLARLFDQLAAAPRGSLKLAL